MLSDLTQNGILPIEGGALNQAECFLRAHELYVSEKNRIEVDDAKK